MVDTHTSDNGTISASDVFDDSASDGGAFDASGDSVAELSGTAVFDATGDRGSMPSWDELVRQHGDRVYRLAYRLSGNAQDAEDLTQDTFIRVFRSLQNYQPGTFEAGSTASPRTCSWTWCAAATASAWRRCRRTTTGCRPKAEPRGDLPRRASRRGPAVRARFAGAGVSCGSGAV